MTYNVNLYKIKCYNKTLTLNKSHFVKVPLTWQRDSPYCFLVFTFATTVHIFQKRTWLPILLNWKKFFSVGRVVFLTKEIVHFALVWFIKMFKFYWGKGLSLLLLLLFIFLSLSSLMSSLAHFVSTLIPVPLHRLTETYPEVWRRRRESRVRSLSALHIGSRVQTAGFFFFFFLCEYVCTNV